MHNQESCRQAHFHVGVPEAEFNRKVPRLFCPAKTAINGTLTIFSAIREAEVKISTCIFLISGK